MKLSAQSLFITRELLDTRVPWTAPLPFRPRTKEVSPIDDQTFRDFLSGVYDRKPEKQRNWGLFDTSGGQFWMVRASVDQVSFGEGTKLDDNYTGELRISKGGKVEFGDYCQIGDKCIIHAGKSVRIGDGTTLGKGVLIMDRNHHPLGASRIEKIEDIEIGKNVVIGDHSIVLLGAKIPDNTVIPPMTVVTSKSPYVMQPATEEEKEVQSKKFEALTSAQHVLPFAYEHLIRQRLADGEGVSGVRATTDLSCLRVEGPLDKITVTEGTTDFYARPWGPPQVFVSDHTFGGVSLGENSFVHHSSQMVALRHSIKIGKYCNISWRCAFLADLGQEGEKWLEHALYHPQKLQQLQREQEEGGEQASSAASPSPSPHLYPPLPSVENWRWSGSAHDGAPISTPTPTFDTASVTLPSSAAASLPFRAFSTVSPSSSVSERAPQLNGGDVTSVSDSQLRDTRELLLKGGDVVLEDSVW
eukprot:CAMPEP_0113878240 /NCGR_PEP_ID=MMETSP0780_2-20120614/6561_1 /TAXON_ID=652834 /ORGANISM="Palpitomonas bilix" /LENGTH=471 /DNA_ID=CAMNT_0000864665 /DNA_START=341 /DNA_END=1753 /DNA_ORIENTATION=+ /assembly_acc=CAM_ASM_000599